MSALDTRTAQIKAEKSKLYTQLKNLGAIDEVQYGKYISRLSKPSTKQQLEPADIGIIFQYLQANRLSDLPGNVLNVIQNYAFQTRTGKFVIRAPAKKERLLDGGPLDRKIRGLLRQLRFAIRLKASTPQSFDGEKLQAQAALAASQRQNSLSYAINRLAARIIKYGSDSSQQAADKIKNKIISGATSISQKVADKFIDNDNLNTNFQVYLNSGNPTELLNKQQQYLNARSAFSQRYKGSSSQTLYDPTQIADIAAQIAQGTFNFNSAQNIQRVQQQVQLPNRQMQLQNQVSQLPPPQASAMVNESQNPLPINQSQVADIQRLIANVRAAASQQEDQYEEEEQKQSTDVRLSRYGAAQTTSIVSDRDRSRSNSNRTRQNSVASQISDKSNKSRPPTNPQFAQPQAPKKKKEKKKKNDESFSIFRPSTWKH